MMKDFEAIAIRELVPNAQFARNAEGLHWDVEENNGVPCPTEAEITAKIAELEAAEPMRLLRAERNQRLANTDWWASSDLTMTAEQTAYRTALRDITDTYTSLDDVVWPEVPNE